VNSTLAFKSTVDDEFEDFELPDDPPDEPESSILPTAKITNRSNPSNDTIWHVFLYVHDNTSLFEYICWFLGNRTTSGRNDPIKQSIKSAGSKVPLTTPNACPISPPNASNGPIDTHKKLLLDNFLPQTRNIKAVNEYTHSPSGSE
jgi:hypothetical protein